MQFRHRNRSLSLHGLDVCEFFLPATAEVLQHRIVLQHAGENFEVRNPSRKRVRHSSKHIKGHWLLVRFVPLGGIAIAPSLSLHPLVLGGCGSVVHNEIHHAVCADVPQPRTKDNGENLVLADRVVQRWN